MTTSQVPNLAVLVDGHDVGVLAQKASQSRSGRFGHVFGNFAVIRIDLEDLDADPCLHKKIE